MSNVSEWSVTAGSNNGSPPNGWPEGMARSAVNDCAREMMAALAKWYQDSNATLVSAGTSTAYTLTTNNVYASLTDIPILAFRVDETCGAAPTLAVDGLVAKSITKTGGSALSAGDLVANQIVVIVYNPNQDRFEIVGPPQAAGADIVSSGTLMLFQQTAAPTGWTKQATHNDKALRVVTGTASSGGSTAFTSVLTSRTIATANLPAHTHTGTTSTNGDHTHSYSHRDSNTTVDGSGGTNVTSTGTDSDTTSTNGDHTHTFTTSSVGSGTAMDFAVQYVDVIIASRN